MTLQSQDILEALNFKGRPRHTALKIGATTVIIESQSPNRAYVLSVRTATKLQKTGHARRALAQICDAADRAGIDLEVWASPLTKRTSRPRLVSFYQSQGFRLTGRTVNAAGDPEMLRKAKAP